MTDKGERFFTLLRMTARGRLRMTVGRFAQWQGGN